MLPTTANHPPPLLHYHMGQYDRTCLFSLTFTAPIICHFLHNTSHYQLFICHFVLYFALVHILQNHYRTSMAQQPSGPIKRIITKRPNTVNFLLFLILQLLNNLKVNSFGLFRSSHYFN